MTVMTRFLLILLILSAACAAQPCTTADASCTEWVQFGSGPARSLIYRTYSLDVKNENITRAFILIHGTGRDPDNYFRTATAAAFLGGALGNTVVISPRFASNDGAASRDTLVPNEV